MFRCYAVLLLSIIVNLLTGPLAAHWPQAKNDVTLEQAATQVLFSLVIAAEANAKLPTREMNPDAPHYRLSGDALSELLVRQAAAESSVLPESLAIHSFLLAIGIGLDDSNELIPVPLVSKSIQRIESPELRKRRLAALGEPTMRGRRDLCKHFAVSITLTETFGGTIAESAGLAKELKDLGGKSGFSFEDLQADLAGISFDLQLCKIDQADVIKKLKNLADHFTVESVLPDHAGIPSHLSAEQFKHQFGDAQDERFHQQMNAIRNAINSLYQ
jgi:hypothetical protein